MIYFVTNQTNLSNLDETFITNEYTLLAVKEAIKIISSWDRYQFDTETNGRDAHINNLMLVQFGNKVADIQIVIDVTTVNILLFKDILEKIPMIGQNLKFDLQFLYKYKITPTKVYDTMIVEQLLYLGFPSKGEPGGIGFSLQDIALRRLDTYIDKTVRGQIQWRGVDTEVIKYAAGDVMYLEDILESQWKDCIDKSCTVGAQLENQFVPVIAYLEWCGIKLDVNKWKAKMLSDNALKSQAETDLNNFIVNSKYSKYYKIDTQGDLFSGFNDKPICTINWNSSTQVIPLCKDLGFNTQIQDKKTGEDKDSVIEKHLKKQKGINDTFLSLYFKYKEYDKVCSTYGQTYIDAINPITGRIHTQFRQLGADSGRMACGSKQANTDLAKYKQLPSSKVIYPQLQNLPADKKTREAFVCEDNNLMCSCDYSALESRLGADIYNEPAMIDEFINGSGDIHSLMALTFFEKEIGNISTKEVKNKFPELRKKAKSPEFLIQFGGSAFGLAAQLACPIEEAENYVNSYYNKFKGIADFKEKGTKFVKNNGYILINAITGHKLYWHDWDKWKENKEKFTKEFWENYRNTKNSLSKEDWNSHPLKQLVSQSFKVESKWSRLALNVVTQGSGIIILKQAMIDFYGYILKNNLFDIVKICNLVHDEAVIEYPNNMLDISTILKNYMEIAAAKYCKKLPIPAETEIGNCWIH